MPHPFFGVGRYPWSLREAQTLHQALFQNVREPNEIDLIYQECSIDLDPLLSQRPRPMWQDALNGIAGAGLLAKLGERLNARPSLIPVHKAFQAAAGLPDPVLAPVLSGERIFVNRENLRAQIDRMGRANAGAGVLLVRGERASGKSWTSHIVVEHAKAMGEKPIVMAQGVVGSVGDVLTRIFAVLQGRVPKGLTTEPAWYSTVCSEMIRFAEKKGAYPRYWIIVDGLFKEENIRKFFEAAVLNMIDDAFASRFRLILIDYPDEPEPIQWKKGYWTEDRTAEADVKADVLTAHLNQWAAYKRKVLTTDKARELAASVLAKAEAPAPPTDRRPRLERIHDELKSVLDTL